METEELPGQAPLDALPLKAGSAAADDLLMLIFTSGTSGEPKAVRCTHGKIAVPGRMLADRFGLTAADTVYVSMPMFHSNAIMAGWAVGLAAGAAIALRRIFSASGFLPDVRAFGATYAEFPGGAVSFAGAEFSGGTVSFAGAEFPGGTVGFTGTGFCGGTVDFSRVASWTQPPDFRSGFDMSHPPAGVMLPAAARPFTR
jgi:acyl-CoA synthetase (AMP-forming)/AMP-acid ligase II